MGARRTIRDNKNASAMADLAMAGYTIKDTESNDEHNTFKAEAGQSKKGVRNAYRAWRHKHTGALELIENEDSKDNKDNNVDDDDDIVPRRNYAEDDDVDVADSDTDVDEDTDVDSDTQPDVDDDVDSRPWEDDARMEQQEYDHDAAREEERQAFESDVAETAAKINAPQAKKIIDAIPEEAHTQEYYATTLARSIYNEIDKIVSNNADKNLLRGNKSFENNTRISDATMRQLNALADKFAMQYDADRQSATYDHEAQGTLADNPFARAGFEVPTHGDDIVEILRDNYLSIPKYQAWKKNYAARYEVGKEYGYENGNAEYNKAKFDPNVKSDPQGEKARIDFKKAADAGVRFTKDADNKLSSMEEARQNIPQSTRDRLNNLWETAKETEGKPIDRKPMSIGKVSHNLNNEISKALGKRINAKEQFIRLKEVRHIDEIHGVGNEKRPDQLPVTKEAFTLIPDVLENFDDVKRGTETVGRDSVKISKRYSDGKVVIADAIVEDGNLTITTMFIKRPDTVRQNKSGSRLSDNRLRQPTLHEPNARFTETVAHQGDYTNNIQHSAPKSKRKNKNVIDTDNTYNPTPIDKEAFDRIIRQLKKTGLSKVVITDEKRMRNYLNAHFGSGAGDRFFKVWHGSPHDFNEVIDIVEKIKMMATPDGEVYGFVTQDGKIFLDPNKMNANTPIHEFGHLWVDYIKDANKPLYRQLRKTVKDTEIYKNLRDNPAYKDLSDTRLAEEAMAFAIGNKGEKMVLDADATIGAKMKKLLDDLWKWLGERLFGTHELTAEQAANMTFDDIMQGAARDLLSGRKIKDSGERGGNYIGGMETETAIQKPTMSDALKNVPEPTRNWLRTTWYSIVGNNGKAVNGADEHELGDVALKTASVIKDAYGKDVTRQVITAKGVEHIYDHHGKNVKRELKDGQIPIDADMVSMIADVLTNPDNVKTGHPTRTRGSYETVTLSKEYADGTVHVVDAIVNDDTLKVWTAYIWDVDKTNRARSVSHANTVASPATMPLGPSLDPNAPSTSTNNITSSEEKNKQNTKKDEKSFSSADSELNTGVFDESVVSEAFADVDAEGLRPVERPELVAIAKSILPNGAVPQIRKKLKGDALGLAQGDGNGYWKNIQLRADIAKDKNALEKTLSHEIGHILTRHGGDSKYKALHTKIHNAINAMAGRDPKFRAIFDEAYELSTAWRPLSDNPTDAELRYRHKGEEVFADMISILLNDPDLLPQRAPKFWELFRGTTGKRNPFSEVYEEIQGLYAKGADAVGESRYKASIEGMKRAEDIEFENLVEKKTAKKPGRHGIGLIDGTSKAVVDKYVEIKNIVQDLDDAGFLDPNANPYWRLRKISRVGGMQEGYLGSVYKILTDHFGKDKNKNIPKDDLMNLGEYMKLMRIVHERKDFANPGGHTAKTAQAQLDFMRVKFGEEKFKAWENAAAEVNKLRQETVIPILDKAGLLSPELLDYIKNNPYYSTFKVVKTLTRDGGTSGREALGIKHQVGTFQDVKNPMSATLENDAQLLNMAVKNDAIRSFINSFLIEDTKADPDAKDTDNAQNHPKKINEVALKATGMTVRPTRRDHNGRFKSVNGGGLRTVYFLDGGKMQAYDIDKKIADLLYYQPEANGIALRALSKMGTVSREVFINKNPGFWIWNAQRDMWETTKNMPGFEGQIAKYYAEAIGEVWDYVRTGKISDDLAEAQFSGVMLAGSPYAQKELADNNPMLNHAVKEKLKAEKAAKKGEVYTPKPYKKKSGEKIDTFDRMMAQYINTGNNNIALRYLKGASDACDKVMEVQEKAMKLAVNKMLTHGTVSEGYYNTVSKRYKKYFNEAGTDKKGNKIYRMNEELRGHFVRTMAGTSDVAAGGMHSQWINNILLFSNSAIQGLAGTYEAFRINPRAYLKKVAYRDLVTKAPYILASSGLLAATLKLFGVDDDTADDIELTFYMIDERFKGKFDVIPIPGFRPNGRQAFIPLPKSFEGMNVGDAIYNVGTGIISAGRGDWKKARDHQIATVKAIGDYNPITESSAIPLLQLGWHWYQYVFEGKNPVDPFTKYPVIKRKHVGYKDKELIDMGWHTWYKLGGGMLYNPNYRIDEDDPHWVEKALGTPVVGNPLGRVIRLSRMDETTARKQLAEIKKTREKRAGERR